MKTIFGSFSNVVELEAVSRHVKMSKVGQTNFVDTVQTNLANLAPIESPHPTLQLYKIERRETTSKVGHDKSSKILGRVYFSRKHVYFSHRNAKTDLNSLCFWKPLLLDALFNPIAKLICLSS